MVKTNHSTLHTVYNIQQSAMQGSNDTTHRLSRRTAATTGFSPEGIDCQKQTAPRFCRHPIRWAFTSQAFTRWRHLSIHPINRPAVMVVNFEYPLSRPLYVVSHCEIPMNISVWCWCENVTACLSEMLLRFWATRRVGDSAQEQNVPDNKQSTPGRITKAENFSLASQDSQNLRIWANSTNFNVFLMVATNDKFSVQFINIINNALLNTR